MTTDLKTFILELAEKKPNMRAYSMAAEIRKWEKHWAIAEDNYRRGLIAQMRREQNYLPPPGMQPPGMPAMQSKSKPSLWQRFKTWFNAEVEGYE